MSTTKSQRKPPIVIGDVDHERLALLASGAADRFPDVADELMAELDRAKVKPQAKLDDTIIQMGSKVTFSTAVDGAKTVTLVFPANADIASGRISILTPIGAALIGLTEGQSIAWTDRNGHQHQLTIETVKPPEAATNGA